MLVVDVYLKTLTLRGFKSFASATTLNFEPGITCVVGPNGSGKSNVVDALSWVMGEQGAKSLRGGNMADVIFAGTSSRPPLGRAEVSLTIDNSDGVLPIDYTEVTISRTLFRNGGSEYAINGTACRLLDIQELLSDTGMGREMHVIVGQGQLDSVLSATPEDRRAFIEEAAGVLKHRRRKETALRKLESMEANVARLNDLVGEIRRQLGPLARQAEVARKASVVQAEVRDAKARLLADDLVQVLANLEAEKADEPALRVQQPEIEAQINTTRTQLTQLEQQAAKQAPLVNEASEAWYRLSSVRERLRGTEQLAQERIRFLQTPEQSSTTGRDPDELQKQADRTYGEQQQLQEEKRNHNQKLHDLIDRRQQAEQRAAEASKNLTTLQQTLADHREGVAKLTGEVSAQRSRLEATEAEIQRLQNTHAEAVKRAQNAEQECVRLEQDVVGAETGAEELKENHTHALAQVEEHDKQVRQLVEHHRQAQTTAASWRARAEALELALVKADANSSLYEAKQDGVVGMLAEHIQIQPGYENAIAAALGYWAEGVVVDSVEAALEALGVVKETEAGIASLIIADGKDHQARNKPAGVGIWAVDVVTMSQDIDAAVRSLLASVVVVDSLEEAAQVVDHGVIAVTMQGDLLAATHARGGSGAGPSTLEVHAAREEALGSLDQAEQSLAEVEAKLQPARQQLQRAQADAEAAAAALNESGSKRAKAAEELAGLRARVHSAQQEATRAGQAIEQAQHNRETIHVQLQGLLARLEAAQQQPSSQDDIAQA